MFFFFQTAHEIVSHAGTERRDNAEREIKRRHARIELFDTKHARKSYRVKNPLRQAHFFPEQKNRDNRRKNRRKILNRHRRSERNMLHRDEKEIKRGRPENPAQEQKRAVRAFQTGFRLAQPVITKRDAEQTAKKDDFHRRQMRNLFDTDIRHRKEKRRKK